MSEATAVLSDCNRYRYALTRGWAPGRRAIWIMLNPSTADASQDDPTIRRCRSFSDSWGCGALTVVNLYGWRATKPVVLKGLDLAEAIGPRNDSIILATVSAAVEENWPIVAAWGQNADPARAAEVTAMIVAAGASPMCLGVTKKGHPRHPLFVRGDTPLVPYAPEPLQP